MRANLRFLFLMAILVFATRAAGAPDEILTLDLSRSQDLLAVYESGLRPFRINPIEHTLRVEEARMEILFPGVKRFELEVSIASLSVMAENKLSSVNLISQMMKLDEAQAVTEQICAAFEMPATGLAEFIAMVKAARTNPAAAPKGSPRSWTSFHIKRAGFHYGISCVPYGGWDFTFATIYISAQFHEKGKPMRFLTEPIKPPPGFEHVSLERVPRPPRRPAWAGPPLTGEMLQKWQEAGNPPTKAPDSGGLTTPIPTPTVSPQPTPAPVALPAKRSNPFLWIIGAVAALLAVMLVVRRKKPKA
jgi:hypothetical protein